MSFPSYPGYKPSGVEWLGEVPQHWTVTKLKREVAAERAITYGIVQAGPHVPDGVPYIRPADMTDEGGVADPENIQRTSRDIADAYRRSALRAGDLVCSIGPSFGKVMVVPPALDGANLTQGTARVATASSTSARFVFWVLRSQPSVAQWESSIGGATFRALNLGPLAETVLALPPRNEQTAIAAFLDRETAKIDALVAEQERLIELLKEKRQAVISHAVTKGLNPDAPMKDSGIEWLGQVPAHWEVRRLKSLLSGIKTGPFGSALTKDMYTTEGFRVYGQEQVIPADFSIGDYFVGSDLFAELQQYAVEPGDVLVSCVGTFGKVAVVPVGVQPGIINPRLIRLRRGPLVSSAYLALVLRSQVTFEQFSAMSRGGTMDTINGGTLSAIWAALPPPAEQEAVLRYLVHFTAQSDALVAQGQGAIDLLNERRAALISAAVTGQIDVRPESMRTAA